MKNLLLGVCLVIILSKYVDTRELALQALALAQRELAAVDFDVSRETAAQPRLTRAGQEALLAERVRETLREFATREDFAAARVELARIDFIRTGSLSAVQTHHVVRPRERGVQGVQGVQGFYAITLSYDVLQPLGRAAGTALVTSVCESGAGEVRFSDGESVIKTFRCAAGQPLLR